jgi:hypothetical protein
MDVVEEARRVDAQCHGEVEIVERDGGPLHQYSVLQRLQAVNILEILLAEKFSNTLDRFTGRLKAGPRASWRSG